MATKPQCVTEGCEREAYSKGLCSGCYGRKWRAERKAEREVAIAEQFAPKLLTSGVIEGEIILPETAAPPTDHLIATGPAEMQEAQGDIRLRLEQKLSVIEREIVETNAALNEARRNNWATGALTSARNRLVDDETYYNKVLAAVEAGHTIIPEFPIEVFAVRRGELETGKRQEFIGVVSAGETWLSHPTEPDCAPAGVGEYRNPEPFTSTSTRENRTPGAQERGEPRWYTTVRRTGNPVGPMSFPSMTARSPIMRATAKAMEDKVFDQVGVCLPVEKAAKGRVIKPQPRRRAPSAAVGDPLVIGQVVHKQVGSRQKVVSFIIAWHLDLNQL